MIILFHTPVESTIALPVLESDEIPSVFPLPASYKDKITWDYNLEAKHPITDKKTVHLGIDIAAPTGTPVYASGSGEVKKAENLGGWGMLVIPANPQAHISTMRSDKREILLILPNITKKCKP